MRAVFTVDLPQGADANYPADSQLIDHFNRWGWGIRKASELGPADIRSIMTAQVEHDTEVANGSSAQGNRGPSTAPQPVSKNPPTLEEHMKELAVPLFAEMPEVAAVEKNSTIFLGYVQAEQTLFVVSRMVESQITFRLLHRQLPRLQLSADDLSPEWSLT